MTNTHTTPATDVLAAWTEYHRTMSSIAAEMIGASLYFAEATDYATDANVAEAFHKYAARFAAVEVPA